MLNEWQSLLVLMAAARAPQPLARTFPLPQLFFSPAHIFPQFSFFSNRLSLNFFHRLLMIVRPFRPFPCLDKCRKRRLADHLVLFSQILPISLS
ncbi:hypothetical protein GGI42DRAFT_329310 [Trichoderma sp. SZMC 28013]